jgi:dCTP deaminase
MLLSSSEIRRRIADKSLGIEPFSEESLQPASYDLRAAGDAVLKKGELGLISTLEFLTLPADLGATLWGRSSFGRKGVLLGAGYIDPGFRGNLTLCLANTGLSDIPIAKETPIVQILFHPVLGDVEHTYSGRYQDSHGVVPSRL